MADWTKPFTARYRVMRVDRSTGLETAMLGGVTAKKITRNIDSQTFESASVDTAADQDFGSDLLRIYLDAEFEDGTVETVPLGTFVPNLPKLTRSTGMATGTINLDGRLKEAASTRYPAPVTVPAGVNAVAQAKTVLESCGLAVEAEESDYELTTAWSLGVDEPGREQSKLDDANALLDVAGFGAARTDAMGVVHLRKYVEPASRPLAATYREGAGARFLREVEDERDASEIANVVVVEYSTSDGTVIGTAKNEDPADPYSIPSIGYERCASYSYDSLVSQEEADAKARQLLDQQKVVRRVTIEHIHDGRECDDAVQLEYPSAGLDGRFTVRTQNIECGAGCMMTDEWRAFE